MLSWNVPLNNEEPNSVTRNRQFILFDEHFTIHLWRDNNDETRNDTMDDLKLTKFTVWINEAIMIQGNALEYFELMEPGHWCMKDEVCQEQLFRSSVVMNNGYDNVIKFQIQYAIDGIVVSDESEGHLTPNSLDQDYIHEFLPSFEPVYTWQTTNASKPSSRDLTPPVEEAEILSKQETERLKGINTSEQIIEFQYPVYSLLNMRLRNSNLKSQYCILTSLDFQTSRSLIQLCAKYNIPINETRLIFNMVKLELINKRSYNEKSHIEIPTIELNNPSNYEFPLVALPHDSFSMAYKLPPLTPDDVVKDHENIDMKPHRVMVTLNYIVELNNDMKLPIITRWETDVTIKRKPCRDLIGNGGNLKSSHTNGNGILLNNNATLSRISTISISSTARFHNNTASNTNQNRLSGYKPGSSSLSQLQSINTTSPLFNNIKFKFMNDTIIVNSGDTFTLRLQITNLSPQPLDLVIYYNNQTPTAQSTNSVARTIVPLQTLEKKTVWIQKQRQIAEGLILLTNDYKVPLIQSHESYFVDLSLVAIRSGYYSTLNALKLLDLKTQECVEIGRAVSVLVN
ncbi:trafficking protein particle complex II-specific subunit 65 [Monosporozyma servazzii]